MKRIARYFIWCSILFGLLGCQPEPLISVHVFVSADIEGVFWSRPEPRYGSEITGGLAVLKSFLDKQTEPYLLLEGGNWFAQTPEGALSQGDYFNTVAATLPYSARIFTEKDLLYGWPSLSNHIRHSQAPFVLSNVTQSNGKLPTGIKPWLVEEVSDFKIGILGVVNPQGLQNRQRLSGLKIADPVESAQQTVQLLREKGAQAIILLSGLGNSEEAGGLTDTNLAEEISGIDVIISSNIDSENAETKWVGNTLLIYPGSHLDSIGQLQFLLNKNKEIVEIHFEDMVLYKRDYGEDEFVAQEVAQLRQQARNQMTHTVGKTQEELTGNLQKESALGDWAADCLRKWAKADAAVLNSSSMRASLPKGPVTQYDLYTLYPYNDNVTYLTIKGDALLSALEKGLSVPDNFAQISGLKIKYRPTAPAGKRIVSAQIKGAPITPSATYRVAVTDHMLAGGAGHDGYIDSLEFKNTQVEMRTVLRLCLAGNKAVSAPEGKRWSISK